MQAQITPNLWFDTNAEEAADFYVSLFPNSRIVSKQNYPDSPALDESGNFIVSTQITDPSFLYTMSFGLLGSNKSDAPLAPTRRPTSAEEQPYNFELPTLERERSWLNILTMGLLGDDGDDDSEN